MAPSQRPFFLSSFFAAFRQTPTPLSSATNKSQSSSGTSPSPSSSPSTSTTTYSVSTPSTATAAAAATSATATAAAAAQAARLHSPRAMPIPHAQHPSRRRGSDASSEGFREVLGADKMYIGGRTAAGEERFFKLGMVRRVRSGDRLSLDRMSL